MGRGNVCVTGDYEGLFYIDRDDLDVYCKEVAEGFTEARLLGELSHDDLVKNGWQYDSILSEERWEDAVESLIWKLHLKHPSFRECSKWLSNSRKAIMSNKLFYVAIEDNEWSMAVMLVQKTAYYGSVKGMQKKHYQHYLDSIRDILFEQFETLGTYAGAWTSGRISRTDFLKGGEQSA